MSDNRVPTYRSMQTGRLCIGQSHDISDKNGIFEGFSTQGDMPTNSETGKPYFKINENAWDGEWVAGEVQHIPSSEFGGHNE